jgi:AraC family transcriptional regulator
VLYVALDPVFVGETAEALDVYPDRVEVVEQQLDADPTLIHIASALRFGVQVGRGGDRMYGEALSTALTVHLLREYIETPVGPPRVYQGLSKATLARAVEYIHDQLSTELTVAEIARAVHMSRSHFTRLFKRSTGLSPYRYVIEARTKKAKELLSAGKLSLADVAQQVGFADQSHLNRHIKDAFGVTPKMLWDRRVLGHNSSTEQKAG